jgi:uncharacterized membrane protein YfcA
MDAGQFLILGLLGLFGGALSGLVGIGGAAVFVPALLYVAGWDIHEAVGASLVITVFTALSGTLRGIRSEDPVSWKTFAILSSVVAPSTLVGVAISRFSPESLVQVVFAAFLLFLAYPTARGRSQSSEGARKLHPALVLLGGIGIGILAGLTGIGGAALMIPLMVFGFGLGFKTAIATSLAANFLTGIAGAAGYLATGLVQLGSLPTLIAGAVFGAWLGVGFRDRIPEIVLRRGFALLMVFVAVRIIVDAANGP